MKKNEPPKYLSTEAKRWFRRVVDEFDFTSGGELRILEEIAASWDRVRECREIIARDGLTVIGDRGTCIHPAARLETQHRNLILTGCRQLGISQPEK